MDIKKEGSYTLECRSAGNYLFLAIKVFRDSFIPSLIQHRKLSNYFMKQKGISRFVPHLILVTT